MSSGTATSTSAVTKAKKLRLKVAKIKEQQDARQELQAKALNLKEDTLICAKKLEYEKIKAIEDAIEGKRYLERYLEKREFKWKREQDERDRKDKIVEEAFYASISEEEKKLITLMTLTKGEIYSLLSSRQEVQRIQCRAPRYDDRFHFTQNIENCLNAIISIQDRLAKASSPVSLTREMVILLYKFGGYVGDYYQILRVERLNVPFLLTDRFCQLLSKEAAHYNYFRDWMMAPINYAADDKKSKSSSSSEVDKNIMNCIASWNSIMNAELEIMLAEEAKSAQDKALTASYKPPHNWLVNANSILKWLYKQSNDLLRNIHGDDSMHHFSLWLSYVGESAASLSSIPDPFKSERISTEVEYFNKAGNPEFDIISPEERRGLAATRLAVTRSTVSSSASLN
jgi:hypothetical protein